MAVAAKNLNNLLEDAELYLALKNLKLVSPTQYKAFMVALSNKLDREMRTLIIINQERIVNAQGRTQILFELVEQMDNCEERAVIIQEHLHKAKVTNGQSAG